MVFVGKISWRYRLLMGVSVAFQSELTGKQDCSDFYLTV